MFRMRDPLSHAPTALLEEASKPYAEFPPTLEADVLPCSHASHSTAIQMSDRYSRDQASQAFVQPLD